MQKIGVRTEDFQLAYRVMHLLRERKINVEQYSINEPLPHQDSIWIGTPQEVAGRTNEGRPIAAELESIDEMIEEAILPYEVHNKHTVLFLELIRDLALD